jgi:uncharacterized membrane-anchored protein
MKIRIKYQDIVNYVLGSCGYHPLELVIDPVKYEIENTFIRDKKTEIVYNQEEDYTKFMEKISTLKSCIKDFDALQIQCFCREIEQFAPLEINLL